MAEAVFEGAGREPGLQVWRVEQFQPVLVPREKHGQFHCGDSYLVLSTRGSGTNLSWDVHYWLGEATSQDEAGAAAMLAVELDDSLGGAPVQHREVQDHESQAFLGLFKGVRYLPGGVASGFSRVEQDQTRRLYHVKGKRNVRVRQVAAEASSVNSGDCFILDEGGDILVYSGAGARGTERLKAVTVANQIRDQDHAGRGSVAVLDGSASPEEVSEFFARLGGVPEDAVGAAEGGSDEEAEADRSRAVLFRVSDESGRLASERVGSAPLPRDSLRSEDCFVLDTAGAGIFVWIGRGATRQEKVGALARGESFIASNNYPKWTRMERVIEGAEPTSFLQYFSP